MVCGDSNRRRDRGGGAITRRSWRGGKVEKGVAIAKGV